MAGFDRRIIVVAPASRRINARTAAKLLDAVGGDGIMLPGLSPTGNAPATHYWCSWQLTPAQYTQLATALDGLSGQGVQYFDGNTTTPQQVLTTLGLQRLRTP